MKPPKDLNAETARKLMDRNFNNEFATCVRAIQRDALDGKDRTILNCSLIARTIHALEDRGFNVNEVDYKGKINTVIKWL